ncbi:MAG: zinc-binding dehydrogenase [Pseudomonadota bacterium]
MALSHHWCFNKFGPPTEVMEKGQQSLPKPGSGQAIVAVRAVGLNRSDYLLMIGQYFPPEQFPAFLAHEAVGEIVALGPPGDDGENGSKWAVGDRIVVGPLLIDMPGMGVLRDLGLYDQASFLPVPQNFSDVEAAAYWTGFLTIAGALEMAGLGPQSCRSKSLVITAAAGGIGTMCLQVASAWGAEVTATTRSSTKSKQLEKLADHVVQCESPEGLEAGLSALYPKGVDVIVDPLGGAFVDASVKALAPGGQYVGYEWITGPTANYDIKTFLFADATIHGFSLFRLLQHPGLMDRLVQLGLEYADQLRPCLAETFSFDTAPQAFDALAQSKQVGKITIIV